MARRLWSSALSTTLCLWLAACAARPSPPASARPANPSASARPANPSASPAPTAAPPTATFAATQAPPTPSPSPACVGHPGTIAQAELVDPDLPRSLPYRIYLPACAEDSFGQLPTLYLLHGLARTDSQWDDLGADEVADDLIRLRVAQPFLIVMPWERLGLDYETTIVDHLLPYIESEYGGSPDRSLRAIGGISRGAGWALRIGFQHSEQFGAIGLHSPAVLPPDLYTLPSWQLDLAALPALWIDIGERDPLRPSALALTDLLDQLGVEYQFTLSPGYHADSYWALHMEDYLRWYVSNWN